jgi:molybdopterin-containing oxidoreductase family membrane subunit
MLRKGSQFILYLLERSPGLCIWISFLTALIVLAGYALMMTLIHSMEILEFSLKIPWTMMVSNYVFFVGLSTGLCIVSSMGLVFGLERYEPIGKRGLFLALIAIVFGMSSIGLHLGHPERAAIYNLLTPNFRSAMWWMGVFYPAYMTSLAAGFWLLTRAELAKKAAESTGLKARAYRLMALEGLKTYLYRILPLESLEQGVYRLLPLQRLGLSLDSEGVDLKWARIFGALALISGLLAYTVEGTLFAHTEARPFWYGALFPVDFLLGALFCGLALLLASGIITSKVKGEEIPARLKDLYFEMADILALLLSIGFLFITYKMASGLLKPAKAEIIMLFLNGPFSRAFWGGEIAIGLVLPIPILLYAARKRKMTGVLCASIMVLVGYFVKRYDFVVASQVYPVSRTGLPTYMPTLMEILVVAGLIAGFLLVYTLGEKFLPLKEEGLHP